MLNQKKKEINNLTNTQLLIEYLDTYIADPMIFNNFIKDVSIISDEVDTIVIGVTTNEALSFLKKEGFKKKFSFAVKESLEREVNIKFVLKGAYITNDKKLNANNLKSNIVKKYNFNNYVNANFNKQVIKAAKAVCEEQSIFSPLFIYANSGLGKTHLLHAIGNEIINKDKTALYINPDSFTFRITEGMREGQKKVNEIKEQIASFDYLLFDDIQNLGDRNKTLKVLLNIINVAFETNQQIVIAADKTPSELGGFEERFITRFEKGLTLEIKKPTTKDLIEVLKAKIKWEKLRINDWENEALQFIARNYSSSIRSIEGAIKRVKFFSMDNNSLKYTYSVITKIFDQLKIKKEELTPNRIVSVVSRYYKVSSTDIFGKTRKAEIVLARHISMWLIRSIVQLSYKQIGRIFNRDHSTTMSAINKVNTSMKINSAVKLAIKQINSKITTVN